MTATDTGKRLEGRAAGTALAMGFALAALAACGSTRITSSDRRSGTALPTATAAAGGARSGGSANAGAQRGVASDSARPISAAEAPLTITESAGSLSRLAPDQINMIGTKMQLEASGQPGAKILASRDAIIGMGGAVFPDKELPASRYAFPFMLSAFSVRAISGGFCDLVLTRLGMSAATPAGANDENLNKLALYLWGVAPTSADRKGLDQIAAAAQGAGAPVGRVMCSVLVQSPNFTTY